MRTHRQTNRQAGRQAGIKQNSPKAVSPVAATLKPTEIIMTIDPAQEARERALKLRNDAKTRRAAEIVSGLITTYRSQPTSLLSERGENVNFETQDCEHFPGEAGISQHFLRKCIQLMTLRMRIFDKPLRRILTTVNSTISSNLWNSRQDWIGTSTTFLGNILGFFARNFHKSHTRNST